MRADFDLRLIINICTQLRRTLRTVVPKLRSLRLRTLSAATQQQWLVEQTPKEEIAQHVLRVADAVGQQPEEPLATYRRPMKSHAVV